MIAAGIKDDSGEEQDDSTDDDRSLHIEMHVYHAPKIWSLF
jgi:hypothetical protein